jgi:hypothetical protein
MKTAILILGCAIALHVLFKSYRYFRTTSGDQVKLTMIATRDGNHKATKRLSEHIEVMVFKGDSYSDNKDEYFIELYFYATVAGKPKKFHVASRHVKTFELSILLKILS